MLSDIIGLLSLNLDEKKKMKLVREEFKNFCEDDRSVFQSYRLIKYLQLELTDLLDSSESQDRIERRMILKTLKMTVTELDILRMRIKLIGPSKSIDARFGSSKMSMKWTGSKTDLVELMYAMKFSINNGKVTIKYITQSFEQLFQVKLGNVYDIIEDICARKIERTKYLNSLVNNLNTVLEEMDH